MGPTSKQSGGSQTTGVTAPAGVGPFMLTLCRLAAPVSIRPPQAPHLKPFTFFMSRFRQPDGSERLHLHMGYFATLPDAQQWAQLMRAKYPQAVATLAPAALLRQASLGALALAPAPGVQAADQAVIRQAASAEGDTLTDTRVLQILETRRIGPDANCRHEPERPEISLLRPDDTDTRRVLKEAVVQGEPVSFAVQFRSSAQPIDLRSVPSLDIFREYTLYVAEGLREGRSWYSLRLGFFSEAISAKQVAYYVRSSFDSVAVVPISEQERMRAKQNPIVASLLADRVQQRIDQAVASDQARTASARGAKSPAATAPSNPTSKSSGTNGSRQRVADSLEQTLEVLAASEIWNDPDSFSETGVRHLKVDVQKRNSRRS